MLSIFPHNAHEVVKNSMGTKRGITKHLLYKRLGKELWVLLASQYVNLKTVFGAEICTI